MTEKVYIGDAGTTIRLDTTVDLTGVTSVSIEVKKPDESTVSWTGNVVDTTKIEYVTSSGDIDQAGSYYLQAKVTGLSGFSGLGETARLQVFDKFK